MALQAFHRARKLRAHRGPHTHVAADVGIIVLSLLVAVVLVSTHTLSDILASTRELETAGSFIAGMFFTSAFTTAPAIATLGGLAVANSLFLVAFWGALGAALGDLVLFRFVRDRFSEDVAALLAERRSWKRFKHLIRRRYFRWLTFLVGGVIIASPLPDELAVTIIGFSKPNATSFVYFSFVVNFFAILLIGLAARALTS